MADSGNQAYPPFQSQQQRQFYPPSEGLGKPLNSSNGPFQPSGAFMPNPAGIPTSQQGLPMSIPPDGLNGPPPQPPQQVRMQLTGQAGFPPTLPPAAQHGQPPPPNVFQQRPRGGFLPPPMNQPAGRPLMNGPGTMNVRPPVVSNLPPPTRPGQMPVAPNYQSPPFPGYGAAPQGGDQSTRPLPAPTSLGQTSSSSLNTLNQGSTGDSIQSRYKSNHNS